MTVQLSPAPYLQFFDNNGKVLSFGTVATFAAGTSTPQTTWVDATQTTTNTNPVMLDAAGRGNIWLDTSLAYKFAVADSLGNLIRTTDNIISAPIPPSLNPVSGTFIGTGVGFSGAPPTTTVDYVITSGVIVTLVVAGAAGLVGPSNATSFSITGVPVAIQPPTLTQSILTGAVNNGIEISTAQASIGPVNPGSIIMLVAGSATGWTASGSKGWGFVPFTYLLL